MQKLLALLFLIMSVTLFAQKVKIKKGIATVNKEPYLQIDVKKKVLAGIYSATFNSIDGQPLIEFENKTLLTNFDDPYQWNTFKFIGTDIAVEVKDDVVQNVKKPLIKFFYENNLMTDGKLDEAAVAQLKEKYPDPLSEIYEKKEAEQKVWIEKLGEVPERNLKATVMVIGSKISQDGVDIGSWEKIEVDNGSMSLGRFGQLGGTSELVRIFNPDKIPVAAQLGSNTLKTGKDGIKHDITKWSPVGATVEQCAKYISVFLMKNGYL